MKRLGPERLPSVLRYQSLTWLRRLRTRLNPGALVRASALGLDLLGARALAGAASLRCRLDNDHRPDVTRLLQTLPLTTRDGLRSVFLGALAGRHPEHSERLNGGTSTSDELIPVAFYRWSEARDRTASAFARPRFIGHRQPRMPERIDFAAKGDCASVLRDAELAASYGLRAFCIDACLEARDAANGIGVHELVELLDAPELAVRVCVQFAAQDVPAQSANLRHWIKVLRHPRYLELAGTPVVLVDAALADPDEAQRWRTVFSDAGLSPIHLVGVISRSPSDGRTAHGFDGVVAGEPTASPVPPYSLHPVLLDARFQGAVTRYEDEMPCLLRAHDVARGYACVVAGIDSSPVAGSAARICANATPSGYANALRQACASSLRADGRNGLVFIRAWNDWSRGAVIEPDTDTGFAYLEQTRMVLEEFGPVAPDHWSVDPRNIAVVLHLFYADLWPEISDYLACLPVGFRLFVSLDKRAPSGIEQTINAQFPGADIERFENRGRDLLPFITLLDRVRRAGCEYVCKIHSKKSLHRVDGDAWRKDLYDKLLGDRPGARHVLFAMHARPSVGMIGPAGHMVYSDQFRGSNERHINALAHALGFDTTELRFRFAAGTMFWARVDALEPLLALGLDRRSFEEETGQIDGTLAHALERLLPLMVRRAGMSVIDTNQIAGAAEGADDKAGSKPYRWARASRDA
ncbi:MULTISPECIES: rhamnan synthesis F family protein [unclassified Caballeronia]|uniref:rhamnan synthesis F family protein n=1 Tax=unclassified Caballeronia TaxID=2646786 RepID=UPI00286672AF|nr:MULTISPECIES: rhamnan synthesis F family protein [unclassified Caballeronia]MDR5751448.1 rhamnan synthesis F family protein [Caballeronia sp. LZ024]MDR5844411.1 rhamnan synthesis F family protein [Caballeronia sp. LZ031]